MDGLVTNLIKVYALLMKLYPSRYQREFGEERREVFALALEKAVRRGKRALIRLVIYELHDFPASVIRASLREWEFRMDTFESKPGGEHLSAFGLLLGVWPFLLAGPVMAVLPYLPKQAAESYSFFSPLWLAVVCLSLIIGIYAGWKEAFPSWVYPYLVILFFAFVIPLLGWLNPTGLSRFNPWISTSIMLIAILGFGTLTLFLLNCFPRTRKIVYDVRNDWTRLSFGMLVLLAFGTGLYGGDHLPPFSPSVWLPSALVVEGAAAFLLCHNRRMRSVVLIMTMGISFLGRMFLPEDESWAIWPVLLLAALIISPVLVGLFRRPHLSPANGK